MREFEEKLNAIVSNPEAMAQVMELARSLDLGGGQEQSGPDQPPPASGGSPGPGGGPSGGLAELGSLLGSIDPKMLRRLLPLAGELAGGDHDERMQLLYALRPFLRPERRDKVEQAAKAARLLHLGKKFLTTMGGPDV